MENYKGEERILYFKFDGVYLPIGCLSDNSFSETSEMLQTTTRETNGWTSSRPVQQSYSISFNGIQIVTAVQNGDNTKLSYDRLKEIKRSRQVIKWKLQGANFPIVDYGSCNIMSISESAVVNELLTFTGELEGFGIPLMASLELVNEFLGFPENIPRGTVDNNLIYEGNNTVMLNGNNQVLQNNDNLIY